MSENNAIPSLTAEGAPSTSAPAAATPTAAVSAPEAIRLPDNWLQALDQELRDDPSLKHIKDIPTLAKSYVSGQKMIGQEKISIPSKHATADDWKGVFKKLGLPENVDGYNVDAPKDQVFDENFLKDFKKAAYESNILPDQANKLLNWYGQLSKNAVESSAKAAELATAKGVESLKQEWGQAFEQNITKAQAAFRELATPDELKYFNESGLGNDPVVIRMFAKIAGALKEDSFPQGKAISSSKLAPDEAKQEINKIRGDSSHPYNNAKHPNHENAVKEMADFYKYAFPDA